MYMDSPQSSRQILPSEFGEASFSLEGFIRNYLGSVNTLSGDFTEIVEIAAIFSLFAQRLCSDHTCLLCFDALRLCLLCADSGISKTNNQSLRAAAAIRRRRAKWFC